VLWLTPAFSLWSRALQPQHRDLEGSRAAEARCHAEILPLHESRATERRIRVHYLSVSRVYVIADVTEITPITPNGEPAPGLGQRTRLRARAYLPSNLPKVTLDPRSPSAECETRAPYISAGPPCWPARKLELGNGRKDPERGVDVQRSLLWPVIDKSSRDLAVPAVLQPLLCTCINHGVVTKRHCARQRTRSLRSLPSTRARSYARFESRLGGAGRAGRKAKQKIRHACRAKLIIDKAINLQNALRVAAANLRPGRESSFHWSHVSSLSLLSPLPPPLPHRRHR